MSLEGERPICSLSRYVDHRAYRRGGQPDRVRCDAPFEPALSSAAPPRLARFRRELDAVFGSRHQQSTPTRECQRIRSLVSIRVTTHHHLRRNSTPTGRDHGRRRAPDRRHRHQRTTVGTGGQRCRRSRIGLTGHGTTCRGHSRPSAPAPKSFATDGSTHVRDVYIPVEST